MNPVYKLSCSFVSTSKKQTKATFSHGQFRLENVALLIFVPLGPRAPVAQPTSAMALPVPPSTSMESSIFCTAESICSSPRLVG